MGDAKPFVVPCRELSFRDPLHWLRQGWADFRQTAGLSTLFGVVIAVVSIGISLLAWRLGRFSLLAALLSGFVFIAPLLATGLYCVSRRLQAGQTPRLRHSWALVRRVVGQAGVFALIQLIILLIWSRAGMMLNAFFPIESGDQQALLEFLLIGSLIGSVFAALTFATAAFSLPMIADRKVDMVTACVSSINAVLRNKAVMVWWAFLIAVITAIGFATVFVGLIVVMPWLAYAAWHSYSQVLDASDWPQHEFT